MKDHGTLSVLWFLMLSLRANLPCDENMEQSQSGRKELKNEDPLKNRYMFGYVCLPSMGVLFTALQQYMLSNVLLIRARVAEKKVGLWVQGGLPQESEGFR